MARRFGLCWRLFTDRRAVTAIEYSLIAAIMAVALVAVVSNMGQKETGAYITISSEL